MDLRAVARRRGGPVMRIAMLSPVAPAHGKGGVQDIGWSLARGLAARGHDVTLITTARADGLREERAADVTVQYLAGTTPMRAARAWNAVSQQAVQRLHATRALDVIHSVFVPQFAVKEDIVPGLVTHLNFTPTRLGVYPLECTELCGLGHSLMRSQARVITGRAFDTWLAHQKAPAAP